MRELQQFLEVVKGALKRRLQAVSLDLMDIGLREFTPVVVTPGAKQYLIVGWAIRPATGQTAAFTTRVGGEFNETSTEDVEPLVTDLVMKMVDHFYSGIREEVA